METSDEPEIVNNKCNRPATRKASAAASQKIKDDILDLTSPIEDTDALRKVDTVIIGSNKRKKGLILFHRIPCGCVPVPPLDGHIIR